ncbi:uncharacterized protein LOC133508799 isoform X2 [Syngnathoides biaculeatus]|uniref:uncharacterized protein LOC133508799 isoform X2 n=1 Tax=Syngnathoides biaculeatus TaxID=300417 RepID=UPI002ADE430A|nr:uncharacterized protein LOC133508799 isoform X2 [Syngnathoides biaculeatus]
MLLAFLPLLWFFHCGSCSRHELCYGETFLFPVDYSPSRLKGKLYFSPKNGEARRLVYENGKAIDPRLKINVASLSLQHVTEKDNGYFSVPLGSWYMDRITLKVLECADEVQKYYHARYRIDIPSLAEILEFTKLHGSDTVVLWNRSSVASASRMKENVWDMSDLTQDDSGYYNLRSKDYTLMWRKKIIVTEYTNNYHPKEKSLFFMRYPVRFSPWDITFIPKSDNGDPLKVMGHGRFYEIANYPSRTNFDQRLSLVDDGVEIDPVKVKDSGRYEFRDKDGHLGFVAIVEVEEAIPTYVYVIIFVAIVAVAAICCCCIRKCCCKKTPSKTSPPQRSQDAAPGPVQLLYYHEGTQATGPSSSAAPPAASYSYQPSQSSNAPGSVSFSYGPPAYNRVDIHPDPTPTHFEAPQAAVSATQPPAFDCTPSDPGPRFELKGLHFPSDLPLSSESNLASVYTSDKLNF